MTLRRLLVNLGKLVLCGLVLEIGTIFGGLLATMLRLRPPIPPAGADMNLAGIYLALTTPLVALALALIAGKLGGSFLTRVLVLSFFMWIAYTVNTQLEASIFSTYAAGFWFAIVVYLVAAIMCGAAVALLFPPENEGLGFATAGREFFAGRSAAAWAWRLPLAAVAFMPVYFAFGLMVVPFTGEYYRQNMFGLSMPTIDQILPILFIRSLLFLLACLPILILWRGSDRSLIWRLGLALFLLVGFIYMLISTWLPIYVRIPHTLEIFADEFVYAGVITILLARTGLTPKQATTTESKATP